MSSWVPGADGSPYGVHNLPYGVFVTGGGAPRIGVRVADLVLDLTGAEESGLVSAGGTLAAGTLNPLLALGRPAWTALRQRIGELLTDPAHRSAVRPLLRPLSDVELRLPFAVADYVDFYSSLHHASNVGRLFRPGQPPLPPNWRHLPIGYHGRAGTVVVSGTDIVRPSGQRSTPDGPVFGPAQRLDIEAEVGFVVGVPSRLGEPVPVHRLAEHVFGVVLVNDWSARDIQAWEYQPLGPFLGKSFATSISAWVTPLAALEPYLVPAREQDPEPDGYLQAQGDWALDLDLAVDVNGTTVTRGNARGLYWTFPQQLAHATVNGAAVRPGDLFASGTISGTEPGTHGCLLEAGTGYLQDGDTVTLRGRAGTIELGAVQGTIVSEP